jgi:DNA-binding transcriptional regulator YdaS (Cro superfamily)
MSMNTTTITLPAKLLARVEKTALALGTTAQVFTVQAITAHLDRFTLKRSYHIDKLPAMLQAARLRHSNAGRSGQEHDPLVLAANTAHHTLRSLAAVLGCTQPALTQARHGKTSISLERARQIEALTGFKATRGNWPRLRDHERTKGEQTHGRQTKNPRHTKGGR